MLEYIQTIVSKKKYIVLATSAAMYGSNRQFLDAPHRFLVDSFRLLAVFRSASHSNKIN